MWCPISFCHWVRCLIVYILVRLRGREARKLSIYYGKFIDSFYTELNIQYGFLLFCDQFSTYQSVIYALVSITIIVYSHIKIKSAIKVHFGIPIISLYSLYHYYEKNLSPYFMSDTRFVSYYMGTKYCTDQYLAMSQSIWYRKDHW